MALNRDKILREAEKLVQKGKIENAIKEYEKLLKLNPNDANTINRVGDLYGRIGEVEKAIELYERIAEHFTQDGFTTKAIAIFKKINRLAPQRLDIFERLADLYIQQGLTVEAKSQLQILADWYAKNDDLERAVATHRKLLELDPGNHIAHLRMADLLLQTGSAEEAIVEYDKLGQLLIQRSKLDEAERLYRHALEQNPPSGEFLIPICSALLDAGRTTVAREFLDAALQRSQDIVDLNVLDVRCRLAMGESDEALAQAERLLDDDPENDELRLLVGKALLSIGEAVRARDHLLPAAERMLQAGDYTSAQSLLQDLLRATPKDPEVLTRALQAFEPSGDEEMTFTLKAALADALFRVGRRDAARKLYVELLEKDSSNSTFRQRLAQLDQGATVDFDEEVAGVGPAAPGQQAPAGVEPASVASRESAPVAESVAEPAFDPQERLAEAKVFSKYGLVDKAINHLEVVVSQFPDHAEALEQLLIHLVEKGNGERAGEVAGPLLVQLDAAGDENKIKEIKTLLSSVGITEPVMPTPPAADAAAPAPVEQRPEQPIAAVAVDEDVAGVVSTEPAAAVVEASEEEEVVIEFDAEEFEAGAVEAGEPASPEEAEIEIIDEVAGVTPAETAPEATEFRPESVVESPIAETEPLPAHVEASEVADTEDLVEITGTVTGPSTSDLDQLDFFIAQELNEDALRLLERLEAEHPGDSDVLTRRLQLKAKGVLLEDVAVPESDQEDLFAEEEEFIDLAHELESELAEEEALVEEATGRGQEEALLEEVFKEFQKGVAEQLSEEDSDTHFNLGIAYKEMGLLPEAIREFQVSARDPRYFVECCSMIGVCYLDQGMAGQAAEWYGKALTAPDLTPEAKLALRYDLASALEQAGESVQAQGLFEEIAEHSPEFRDVTDRLGSSDGQQQVN
jgi:tetratricopeptide (TPR) repeat protein